MRYENTLVRGVIVSACRHESVQLNPDLPLLVALHGRCHTHRYFSLRGSASDSFVEIANRNGFSVLAVDRPGYGASDPISEKLNTFAYQAAILDDAIEALTAVDAPGCVVLLGHSIGGMVALEISARQPTWNLIGVGLTGLSGGIRCAVQKPHLPSATEVVDPTADRGGKLWCRPTVTDSGEAAGVAGEPGSTTPAIELSLARRWAPQRMAVAAAVTTVPVHLASAEFEERLDDTAAQPPGDVITRGAATTAQSDDASSDDHCVDHRALGPSVIYNQLAFVHSCWRRATTGRDAPGGVWNSLFKH